MTAFIQHMARSYTDEQIVEAAVAAKLCQLVPIEKVIATQAEAKRLVAGVSLNTAIELACESAIPQRSILLSTIHAATEAVTGVALPGQA